MDVRLEIAGTRVVGKCGGVEVMSASVQDFVAALSERADHLALPEPIPDGVRLVRRRGSATVLVIEEMPQVRTVRWLADDSPAPKGPGAAYQTVRLAFPFVVLVVAFQDGALVDDFQQCFYRSAPIKTLDDPLCYPNLYNVRDSGGQECWLCLKGLETELSPLSWQDKVRALRGHLWGAGFNRSVEMTGARSYWELMREVDPRVASVTRWAAETEKDPFFPLTVTWRLVGKSVGQLVTEAMAAACPFPGPVSAADLLAILPLCPPQPAGRLGRPIGPRRRRAP